MTQYITVTAEQARDYAAHNSIVLPNSTDWLQYINAIRRDGGEPLFRLREPAAERLQSVVLLEQKTALDASTWQPITTAPQNVAVDIAARRWDSATDRFIVRRFVDCILSDDTWTGVKVGWVPTHWFSVPVLPAPPRIVAAT